MKPVRINPIELFPLINDYKEEMKKPLNITNGQIYDEGYIDGVVDILGDLISKFEITALIPFAEEMEKIQTEIYNRKVGK